MEDHPIDESGLIEMKVALNTHWASTNDEELERQLEDARRIDPSHLMELLDDWWNWNALDDDEQLMATTARLLAMMRAHGMGLRHEGTGQRLLACERCRTVDIYGRHESVVH